MINLILWLLFGALVGWLASIVMRTDAQQGTLLNIVVGIIGAMIGGYLAAWAPTDALRVVLAVILAVSAFKLWTKGNAQCITPISDGAPRRVRFLGFRHQST
jgi:uncharacterized membrane protein YeaQ/YmgE (transglycosylase-associated protein family)